MTKLELAAETDTFFIIRQQHLRKPCITVIDNDTGDYCSPMLLSQATNVLLVLLSPAIIVHRCQRHRQ
jgi:hypothetical protein